MPTSNHLRKGTGAALADQFEFAAGSRGLARHALTAGRARIGGPERRSLVPLTDQRRYVPDQYTQGVRAHTSVLVRSEAKVYWVLCIVGLVAMAVAFLVTAFLNPTPLAIGSAVLSLPVLGAFLWAAIRGLIDGDG